MSASGESPTAPPGFRVERHNARNVVQNPVWVQWVPRVLAQVDGRNFTLDTYLVFVERDNRPIGAGSILRVYHGVVWYDNVPVLPGEARLVGLHVLPEYRGQGLGILLQRQRMYAAKSDSDLRLISAIVEAHRVPSIRAQRPVFKNVTNNLLVKAAGRNVLSLVTGGEHKGLWYVGPGRNCRWRNNG